MPLFLSRWLGFRTVPHVIRQGKLYTITTWFGREIKAVEVFNEHSYTTTYAPEAASGGMKREKVRELFTETPAETKVNHTRDSEYL